MVEYLPGKPTLRGTHVGGNTTEDIGSIPTASQKRFFEKFGSY